MIPSFPDFKELSLDDIPELNAALALKKRSVCELALANLFIWKDIDNPKITKINDNICILTDFKIESPFFFEPLGDNLLSDTLEKCFTMAGKISRVSADFLQKLDETKYFHKCLRSQGDYIYLTKDLAELLGKKYDGKRNHIKKFTRLFPGYSYVRLTKEMSDEAMALFEKWQMVRMESQPLTKVSYEAQKMAIKRVFEYFDILGLFGGAIFANDRMKAFTIGSPVSDEMVSIHFSYTDPAANGASQTVLWEGCNKTYDKYKYVNLEQDLGILGLRKAKLSYHPLKLEDKFEITKKIL